MTGGSPGEASDAQRLLLACHLVFKNALELGAEAELLLEHSHFARAYFLSHIASEELGKVPYLLAAAEGAERGVGVDWRALRRQLEDHREKLRALAYLDHVAVPNEQQLEKGLDMVKDLDHGKNAALYVTVRRDLMGTPSALDWEELARVITSVVASRLQYVLDHGLADDATYLAGITNSPDSPLADFARALRAAGFTP